MTRPEPIVGVLLAGGQSRRMGGGDKCLLEVAGKPLLAHVIDKLEPQTDVIVLNANGNPERFARFGLPVIADSVAGFAGPLAGVLAGFTWARRNVPETKWIATAATDTPFFPADLVEKLLDSTGGNYPAIALASSDGQQHPVFGLWPTDLADDLEQALHDGIRKVLHWTDSHATSSAEFDLLQIGDETIDPFFNANTPEDLERAAAILGEGAPL